MMPVKGYNNADPVKEQHEDIVCRFAIERPWKTNRNRFSMTKRAFSVRL